QSDVSLSCVTPPGAPGTRVDVRVTNANGAAMLAGGYRYHLRPELHAIAPADGSALGGLVVTLPGTGCTRHQAWGHVVRFGGAAATGLEVLDDSTLRCVVPAGNAGARVDVVLETSNGASTLPGAFRYHLAPDLTRVEPLDGTPLGGTAVTLTGSAL